jgi:hypothetical protein
MNKMNLARPATEEATQLSLSSAGHKILRRLKKGSAYQVHGAWRFRGLRSPISEPTLLSLLAKGLAERVEIDGLAQIRINPAGRSVNEKKPPEGDRRSPIVTYHIW